MKVKKVLLCLFGVMGRSPHITFDTIKANIINHLQHNDITVDVYAYNIIVDNALVDGKKNDNVTWKELLPFTEIEEELQSCVDIKIKTHLQHVKKCQIWGNKNHDKKHIQNAIRQMYSEYMCGKYIDTKAKQYDAVIVCGPDYYIPFEINISHIHNCTDNENAIYFSRNNNCSGFTNGFYISTPKTIKKLLNRYNELPIILPVYKDYEYILKLIVDKYKIKALFTDMLFFKIRSNNHVYWPGSAKLRKQNLEFCNHKEICIDAYNKLTNNKYNEVKNMFSPLIKLS